MQYDYGHTNKLYRLRSQAKVSGVCAGLARFWGIDRWIVRLIAIGALIFLPMPTAVAYLLATILLPVKDI